MSVISTKKSRGVETHRFIVRERFEEVAQPTVELISYDYGQSFIAQILDRNVFYYDLRLGSAESRRPIQEFMAVLHVRYLEIVKRRDLA